MIALGFLAILTIMIIAFAVQTRTERISGRSFLTSAHNNHLLQTALARAMEDIDQSIGTAPPSSTNLVLGTVGDTSEPIADTVDFTMEKAFFQSGNAAIASAFRSEQDVATWETVQAGNGDVVGRIGYFIINSSGFLDANQVGGTDGAGDYIAREAGLSPKEIQLSNSANIIPEFSTGSSFNHYGMDHQDGNPGQSASVAELSPGLAFAHNRNNAWRRFESLRDVQALNDTTGNRIIPSSVASFSTFSFTRPGWDDGRTFMGTNQSTLAEKTIEDELVKIPGVDSQYVMNQLTDYLDTDTEPTDIDYSVEPVPLINEFALTSTFIFTNETEVVDNGDGSFDTNITVYVTNNYVLEIEVWYPFAGYTNPDDFSIRSTMAPIETGALPTDLFGDIGEWMNAEVALGNGWEPNSAPIDFIFFENEEPYSVSFDNPEDLIDIFEEMRSDIQFPLIECWNDSKNFLADRVVALEFPIDEAIDKSGFMDSVDDYAAYLFNANNPETITSLVFNISMSVNDPRLNWDGDGNEFSDHQWVDESSAYPSNETASVADTLGAVNSTISNQTTVIFVRNEDRIDTPWEFTYFLYDTAQPWQTKQMLKANDGNGSRMIMESLSPHPSGTRPRHGLVNPYSPHTNVIASVFMGIPLDEFNMPAKRHLSSAQASQAAGMFMDYVAEHGWPDHAADLFENDEPMDAGFMEKLLNLAKDPDSDTANPWEMEAFFRNTFELFNPHDTLYTILLAAQTGTDVDGDGTISDDEVRGTQKAVAYVWRDPVEEKAAVVFWGLGDTLQKFETGESWGTILDQFKPD